MSLVLNMVGGGGGGGSDTYAFIVVTYPAGSTCTATDGTTTLTAPDTSGNWVCKVPNAGTWTVFCTNGTDTASTTVVISTEGQSVSVTLSYWDGGLYVNGDEYTGITGGWVASPIGTITNTGSTLSLLRGATGDIAYGNTDNAINLGGFSTLKFTGYLNANPSIPSNYRFGLATSKDGEWVVYGQIPYNTSTPQTVSIDISVLDRTVPYYVRFSNAAGGAPTICVTFVAE